MLGDIMYHYIKRVLTHPSPQLLNKRCQQSHRVNEINEKKSLTIILELK